MKCNLFVLTLMVMGNVMFSMDNSELRTALSNLEINEHNDVLDKEGLRFVLGLKADDPEAVSFDDTFSMGKPAQDIIKAELIKDLKEKASVDPRIDVDKFAKDLDALELRDVVALRGLSGTTSNDNEDDAYQQALEKRIPKKVIDAYPYIENPMIRHLFGEW